MLRKENTIIHHHTITVIFYKFLQRQGCIHGEEMDYIFGIPLNYKLSKNYTRQEEHLSEMVLTYWSNFITSG